MGSKVLSGFQGTGKWVPRYWEKGSKVLALGSKVLNNGFQWTVGSKVLGSGFQCTGQWVPRYWEVGSKVN